MSKPVLPPGTTSDASISVKPMRIDRKRLGEMMSPWGGDGDRGIGPVGSYYYGGHVYPDKSLVENAMRDALRFIPMANEGVYGWTKKDAKDLKKMAAGLRYYLERDYK